MIHSSFIYTLVSGGLQFLLKNSESKIFQPENDFKGNLTLLYSVNGNPVDGTCFCNYFIADCFYKKVYLSGNPFYEFNITYDNKRTYGLCNITTSGGDYVDTIAIVSKKN
jgi:hypothetical protein